MRIRLTLLLVFLAAGTLGLPPAEAVIRTVSMSDCLFKPDFRALDVGDEITWTYSEGGCSPQNHRVRTYGAPPETFDSSPSCATSFSTDPSCMNDGPIKQSTFRVTFDLVGTYTYYCPFHASLSGGTCNGMCGRIVVSGEAPPPTRPPLSTPPATGPPKTPPPPTSTASPTATASPSPTGTASASPSPTSTELARGEEGGDGGPGRGLVALASVAVLGSAAFLVWRTFIAAR